MNIEDIFFESWIKLWSTGTPPLTGDIVYCDPGSCDECVYVGEGGFYCGTTQKIVMEDFEPTEHFMGAGCPHNKHGAYFPRTDGSNEEPLFLVFNIYKLEDGTCVYAQRWFDDDATADGADWVTYLSYLAPDDSMQSFFAIGKDDISRLIAATLEKKEEQAIRRAIQAAREEGRI